MQKTRSYAGLVSCQRLISDKTFFRNIQRKQIKLNNCLAFSKNKKGRGQAKLVEQAELIVKREYVVLWKKQTVDPNKLAKLYWDQGLTQTEIARRFKIRRATVLDAVKRFKPTLLD